jgi:TRAP transporter TAXI family solute receptor
MVGRYPADQVVLDYVIVVKKRKGRYNMKRLFVLLVAVSVCALFYAQTATSAEKVSSQIAIGTHPIGSVILTIGTATAKALRDHAGIRAVTKPMVGPVAWFPYMERGEIQLGLLNQWDAEKGYLGESTYEKLSGGKGFSVRLICPTIYGACSMSVAGDSGIYTIPQLKGKRVAGNFPTPSLQLQADAFLANGNLTWKDIVPVTCTSPTDATKAVMEGRADATGTTQLGMPITEELNAKKGARMLPIDPSDAAVARTRKFFPGYPIKVEPGPGNTGVEKEEYLWAYDFYLIAEAKLPDDLVYTITKTLYENTKDFPEVSKQLVKWTPDRFVSKNATLPYHPGAIKFYKEKGLWNADMDKLQNELLKEKAAKK